MLQPDKRVLDQVSTKIPIFILHISAHLACANSAALALAQITASTPDPADGVIGRLPDSMEPNGYLEEAGMQMLQAAIAPMIKADPVKMMEHMQKIYLENGVTTAQARLNMIASVFVGHVWYWGDVHKKNFGEKRGNHISPVKDALERGIHVNFHQDTPVTKPDMLHSVWCAVNRLSRGKDIIGADQKIPVYDALRAVTIEAAYEYFEENSKGTIEVGKSKAECRVSVYAG